MSETVTPWKFSVEGEAGLESDERIGAGPRWVGNRGGGEGDAAAVHGGVQAEDRPGGRRLQDAGRGWGVAAAGGGAILGPRDYGRRGGGLRQGRGGERTAQGYPSGATRHASWIPRGGRSPPPCSPRPLISVPSAGGIASWPRTPRGGGGAISSGIPSMGPRSCWPA